MRPLLVLLLSAAALAQPARNDNARAVFREIDAISKELEKISGLEFHKRVACDLISKEKVNEFLKKKVKEVSTPQSLRAEELTLKKFGLVPPDFDLAASTVDVLTEQAAAFYDYHSKKLFITDWTPSGTRDVALAHELAHALADQNFGLKRYIRQARMSDDAALARMAVMEGQATWLMSEYMARKMGQSLLDTPGLADSMNHASDTASGQFPVFDNSPLYIRETLLFPYNKGMMFQQAVAQKLGKAAIAEVFHKPPVSTRQILHADDYFSGAAPTMPPLPKFSQRGYKGLIQGTFGELDHAVFIRQFAGAQRSNLLAPHWRGGQYELLENRAEGHVILTYASEWDEPEFAADFFQVYRRSLEQKWKHMEVRTETKDSLSGTGDDGDFILRREGNIVTSIEGMPSGNL